MRTAFMLPLLFLVAAPAPASAQTLSVTPGRLSFLAAEGSAAPVPQQVTVRPAVGATFTWRAMPSAPWLRVSPATGQGTETVTVTINATALAAGSYAARITIAAVGGMNVAPVVVDVSVQIAARKPAAAPPARGAAPSTGAQHAAPVAGGKPGGVTLAAPEGSTDPVESSVTIESPRTGAIEWFARTDKSWLAAEPRSGVTPGRVTVRANPAGLAAGSYTALLQIVDDAREPMLDVPVVLTVGSPAAAAPEPQGAAAPAAKPVETPAAPTTTEAETQAPLSIAGNALPPAIRNLPYSQAIPVKGGKPPYAIRIADGRLPLGLVLANGTISGMTRFPGSYPLKLEVSDSSAPPQSVQKVLALAVIIAYQNTALTLTHTSLALFARTGQRQQGASIGVGSGGVPLGWTVKADQPWLILSPSEGVAPGGFNLNVDASKLEPGVHVAVVTVSMEGAPNSPMRVPVQVTVRR